MFLDGGPMGRSARAADAPKTVTATSAVTITFILVVCAIKLRLPPFSR
jgi:hypothetical protein